MCSLTSGTSGLAQHRLPKLDVFFGKFGRLPSHQLARNLTSRGEKGRNLRPPHPLLARNEGGAAPQRLGPAVLARQRGPGTSNLSLQIPPPPPASGHALFLFLFFLKKRASLTFRTHPLIQRSFDGSAARAAVIASSRGIPGLRRTSFISGAP